MFTDDDVPVGAGRRREPHPISTPDVRSSRYIAFDVDRLIAAIRNEQFDLDGSERGYRVGWNKRGALLVARLEAMCCPIERGLAELAANAADADDRSGLNHLFDVGGEA